MTLGGIMGSFIVYLKVQPFIATLAGMWFARGMCFFISDDAVTIDNPIFQILGKTKILIPGLTEIADKTRQSTTLYYHSRGCWIYIIDSRDLYRPLYTFWPHRICHRRQ